jgi:hypothetical protein
MRSLFFRFFLRSDCVGADGLSVDYDRMAAARPVDSIRARPEAVFRSHLDHLGFFISNHLPALEGKVLDVELRFHGDGPKRPVLVAFHEGEVIAMRTVHLQTLDTSPFSALLIKRRPELHGVDLMYTVAMQDEDYEL